MTPAPRVALVGGGRDAERLGATLNNHHGGAVAIAPRSLRPVQAALRIRGFDPSIGVLPTAVAALGHGGFDIVHAFGAAEAVAALAWRTATGRPVVFTSLDELHRERLARHRLSLPVLRAAVERSDAVLAATEPVRASMERWLAVDVPVLDLADGPGHEQLYRELLAGSASSASAGG